LIWLVSLDVLVAVYSLSCCGFNLYFPSDE
jgi:predicted small lipoprotein YifL